MNGPIFFRDLFHSPFNFNPSGVFLRFRQGRDFAVAFLLVGLSGNDNHKKGGMTQNESYHPKFLHKKRWLTITIFIRYML